MRARFRLALAAPLVSLLAAAAGPGPAASAAGAGITRPAGFTSLCGALAGTQPATVAHVMVIVMENKSFSSITGSRAADPYLRGTLIHGCGLATNYHGYSHPSLPNYLALTSGTAQGKAVNTDCFPASCPQPQDSIYSQLGNAGQTWQQYAEAMPASCYTTNYDNTTFMNADGSTGEYYYPRHAPAPYYSTAPVPAECASWDVPLGTTSAGSLASALSPTTDGLPAFSFVTPGGCNDMHDCPVATGDDWLSQWIPLIQQSAAYQNGQLVVFVTWDEGAGADKVKGETCWDATHANSAAYPSCHVATIVMSPYTTPATRSSVYFNHLSLLGTAEDLLGLPRLPGAQGYTGLQSAFGL